MVVVHSLLGQSATANEVSEAPVPEFHYQTTATPTVTAQTWYSLDVATEQALTAQAADVPRPIASITKLITSAVFYSQYSADTESVIAVTESDVLGMGRAGALTPGEQYPLSVLPFPALLTSANTASALMARSGTADLIERTNQYAAAQGFTKTRLADAHGLSDRNVSTAAELAAWFLHVSEVTPTVRDITRLKQYMHDENGWRNNNPFIDDQRYQGGKHGYTEAAGRTVVASFMEPVTGGPDREIVYVLLGSSDLTGDMQALRQHVQAHTSYR